MIGLKSRNNPLIIPLIKDLSPPVEQTNSFTPEFSSEPEAGEFTATQGVPGRAAWERPAMYTLATYLAENNTNDGCDNAIFS